MSKKIIIQKYVYEKFYEILSDEFFHRYFSSWQGIPPRKGSREMWEYIREGRSNKNLTQYTSSKLFGVKSHEFFYRKFLDAKKFNEVQLDIDVFTKALEFIGVKLEDPYINNLNPVDKIKKIYEKFLILYFYDFYANKANNTSPSDIIELINKNNTSYEIPYEDSIKGSQISYNVDIEKINILFKNFYNYLSEKKFKKAWDLLTSDFQKRVWRSDLEKFKAGYEHFRLVRNLAVFNAVQYSPFETACLVYYEDEVDAYQSAQLEGLKSITVGEIDKFAIQIMKIRERAKELDIKDFDNVEILKLFDPVASEYLIYKSGFYKEEQYDFFSSKNVIIVKRLYHVSCVSLNRKWLIDRIRTIPTYSSR
jgi:hypothetical protein